MFASNGQLVVRQSNYQPCIKVSLPWLDVRVFYVRISKCEIDDSAPEFLTVNHIPLDPDTLLEVNGVRTSINSDGATTLLRRDRLDKKSEEATFVSTDSIRMTGSVKFEVFDKDVVVLSGVLELCNSNGFNAETDHLGQRWSMNCESDISASSGFFKGKQFTGAESASPLIEVYIAGLAFGRSMRGKGCWIPYQSMRQLKTRGNNPSRFDFQESEYSYYKPENGENMYWGTAYLEGEDGELSWFNAGVRVGVGIGLSICVGVGIGVGLLIRTYQGTTRNFRRQLLYNPMPDKY
ncbi:Erythronate-4-phosphate dehydrogenase family protein [Prunus dulcis]|uniref:Erythronate-4-phosphate dehydrogenase family protein n=1 Tax=Prunus dulcis TaxID=3755 RepID=A0A4Y1RZH1_PRUDU|nr:Erythronate-4-phosphate dehydrogenase family protein [Prunus dulcis]BBH09407.1 Erythronate-4-phosphate dehydrogenase family protein [Prunus dulcis]